MSKKKFPYWATTLVQEEIASGGVGGERAFTLNKDEDRLTDLFMSNGFLKDTLPTHTDINTLLHLITHHLNRPEIFNQPQDVPAASNEKYIGRLIQVINGGTRQILFSDGSVWKNVTLTNIS